MTTITTNTRTDVAVKVSLKDILETVFAGNEELKSFDLLSATTSSSGGGSLIDNGILTFSFSRNEKDEKELKAPEFPMTLRQRPENPDGLTADELSSQQRAIVRAALGTDSTFYTGAAPEVQARVEEIIITAWKESGTSEDLSGFALPYYRLNVLDTYDSETGKFAFQDEPAMTQRDEIRRVLESRGSDSFLKATPEVQEQVITKCLELLDGKPFSYNWYLDNIFYPFYDKLNQQFSFAWEPTDDQKREAKAILGIRIPFGQLPEEDKDKAVLEVLRKWHEDGEKETLRTAGLYANYFKGSELYLTTEFGKQNQGRI